MPPPRPSSLRSSLKLFQHAHLPVAYIPLPRRTRTRTSGCSSAYAFNTAKDAISSIFHKSSSPSISPDTSPAIGATTVTAAPTEDIVPLEDEDFEKEGGKSVDIVASVDDYGVAHLDLEGDPNCDYTTKVRIAGSEYNVIIDTGSAHFAVASNACKDCIIQRKDHFRLNEEEEIPIDADFDLTAAAVAAAEGGSSPFGGLSGVQMPLNLLKERPRLDRESSETTSTATMTTTTSSGSTMTVHTAMTTSTLMTQHPLVSSISQAAAAGGVQDAFHVGANSLFPDNLEQLKKMQADIDAVTAAAAVVNAIRPIVPAGYQGSGVGNHQSPLFTTSEGSHKKRRFGGSEGEGRALVAAPAENLYPLSNNAREQGESIRVSYGIKTHSVGWTGVMTSDLLTLDMAKVKSGNSNNSDTTTSAATTATVDAPGTLHLEDGGSMEKETNVGFAAITENTGFFSQECGAQHGIWGLGYRSLSVDRKPTLFDTLSASMKIPNGFALQLCGRVGNTTKSGNMFLGGYSTSHLAEPMQFVPLVQRDWYQVQLDGFKVMGQPVQGMANLNLPKTIVDSGTTNILMSHYNLQFLIDALSRSEV
ncbi:Beta-secretase 2, partial [Linnemannia exigua]